MFPPVYDAAKLASRSAARNGFLRLDDAARQGSPAPSRNCDCANSGKYKDASATSFPDI